MPGRDRTGPCGEGPASGRGAGFCREHVYGTRLGRSFYGGGPYGLGRRGRPGRGHGYRARYWAEPAPHRPSETGSDFLPPAEEVELLRAESDRMQSALDAIRRRLEQLETA